MSLDRILVVDDELIIRKSIEEVLRAKRYSVVAVGTIAEAEKILKRDAVDLMFLDIRMPDGEGTDLLERLSNSPERPLTIMMSGFGTIETAVTCMRHGAFDYLIKPFSLNQIEVLVKKAESYRQVLKVNRYFSDEITKSVQIVGDSQPIVNLKQMIRKVAPTEATVLICGENGTGKELVANEIYNFGARSQGPYIKINCAAVAENLIESEFFGHEKGAFTGATERRDGRFELANGGTLLLDEISEISPRLQAKLLRVLQEREFERVGGSKTIKVDVRILATTNRDLKKSVAAGEFREDLFYRLNVFPLHVPPLRERKEDIPLLAETFLQRFARRHGSKSSGFSKSAMETLLKHDWPGNIRELQNTVERAVILAEGIGPIPPQALGILSLGSLPHPPSEEPVNASRERIPELQNASNTRGIDSGEPIKSLDEVEKEHILRALECTGGNRTQAAALLKISIRTLRNKLNEYKLETA